MRWGCNKKSSSVKKKEKKGCFLYLVKNNPNWFLFNRDTLLLQPHLNSTGRYYFLSLCCCINVRWGQISSVYFQSTVTKEIKIVIFFLHTNCYSTRYLDCIRNLVSNFVLLYSSPTEGSSEPYSSTCPPPKRLFQRRNIFLYRRSWQSGLDYYL